MGVMLANILLRTANQIMTRSAKDAKNNCEKRSRGMFPVGRVGKIDSKLSSRLNYALTLRKNVMH